MVAVPERRDAALAVDEEFAVKGRGDDEVVGFVPFVVQFKMRVVVVREKNRVRKFGPEGAENHEFIVDVIAEEAHSAERSLAAVAVVSLLLLEPAREATQVIRLVQPFGRFRGKIFGCCFL